MLKKKKKGVHPSREEPLLLKTRGDSDPHGKQRVFFACHPDDFCRYFKDIADDIFATQNCVIYYVNPEWNYDENDLYSRIDQMQVVVVPVTEKLLKKKNHAMNAEIPYALKQHIPVLPLMQEYLSDEIFRAKFGDLQYLFKYRDDPTAISFATKLENFLMSVLVGDIEAEKIKNEFRATAFLSYRKIDRKYAHKIMKMIHRIPNCRDIAIWYDEYLIPGENFNDAINAAMSGSRLFILAVTPNLLQKKNYVMTIEYPNAVKAGQQILALEVEETNREALEKRYKGIPACVASDDDKGIEQVIKQAFPGIESSEDSDDPMHLYYMGLAYLSGIEVEVDYGRARMLLVQSAEAGVPEAMDKLIYIYMFGKGVEVDQDAGIFWQRRLEERYLNLFHETGDTEMIKKAMQSLFVLEADYEILGRPDEAEQTIYRGLHLLDNVSEPWCARYISIMEAALGDIDAIRGKTQQAKEHYEQVLAAIPSIAKDDETPEMLYHLYSVTNSLGKIYELECQYTKAESFYHQSEKWAAQYDCVEHSKLSRQCVCCVIARLGQLALNRGQLNDAKAFLGKCLSQSEALYQEYKDIDDCRRSIGSLLYLGEAMLNAGEIRTSRKQYEKALALAAELADNPSTISDQEHLMACYGGLGECEAAEGHYKNALKFYQQRLHIAQAVFQQADIEQTRRFCASSYDKIGNLELAEGHYEEAIIAYNNSKSIFLSDHEIIDTVPIQRDLMISTEKIGDVYYRKGSYPEAEEQYRESIDIACRLSRTGDAALLRREMSIIYGKLGIIALAKGDILSAYDDCVRAADIAAEIFDRENTIQSQRDLFVASLQVCNIAILTGAVDEADRCCQKAYEIASSWKDIEHTPVMWSDMMRCNCYKGIIEVNKEQPGVAEQYFNTAVQIFETHPEIQKTADMRYLYMSCCHRLGVVMLTMEKTEEACQWYRKAVPYAPEFVDHPADMGVKADACRVFIWYGICLAAMDEWKAAEDYLQRGKAAAAQITVAVYEKTLWGELAYACQTLGQVKEALGDEQGALTVYKDGLRWGRLLLKETPDEESYDSVALSCVLIAEINEDLELAKEACDIWYKLSYDHPNNNEYAERYQELKALLEDSENQF